jgi:T5orf172 domain
MTPFTTEELLFLSRHNYSEGDVYDGRFKTKINREASAKEARKVLILTNKRCRAQGHRLRTRAGHCAQCNPANIAFTAREDATGYVYIAGSLSGRVIKIGTAKDISQRVRQIRAERYGGFADWEVLISVEVEDAGKVEREAASRILGKKMYSSYFKDGREQMAIEMVCCPFSSAFKALAETIGGIGRASFWLSRYPQYEFD